MLLRANEKFNGKGSAVGEAFQGEARMWKMKNQVGGSI